MRTIETMAIAPRVNDGGSTVVGATEVRMMVVPTTMIHMKAMMNGGDRLETPRGDGEGALILTGVRETSKTATDLGVGAQQTIATPTTTETVCLPVDRQLEEVDRHPIPSRRTPTSLPSAPLQEDRQLLRHIHRAT
jgi:hypothetical protein